MLLTGLFEEAKNQRVNLWLTSERNHHQDAAETFEENIADTVLFLDVERHKDYQRRFIEVRKSRFQREIPGRHPVLIEHGNGIRIIPAGDQGRRARPSAAIHEAPRVMRLGVPGLDRMMGPSSVHRGDLIAFHGAPNNSRTLVGIQFLLAAEREGTGSGPLSFYAADSPRKKMLALVDLLQERGQADLDKVLCFPLAPGWMEPAEILQILRRELLPRGAVRVLTSGCFWRICRAGKPAFPWCTTMSHLASAY